jgi:hypothetical protein
MTDETASSLAQVVIVPDLPSPTIATTKLTTGRALEPAVENRWARIARCGERAAAVAIGRIADPLEVALVAKEASEHLHAYVVECQTRHQPIWLTSVDLGRLREALRGVFGDGEANEWVWNALRARLKLATDPEEERRSLEDRLNRLLAKKPRGPTTLGKRLGTYSSRAVWRPAGSTC